MNYFVVLKSFIMEFITFSENINDNVALSSVLSTKFTSNTVLLFVACLVNSIIL